MLQGMFLIESPTRYIRTTQTGLKTTKSSINTTYKHMYGTQNMAKGFLFKLKNEAADDTFLWQSEC